MASSKNDFLRVVTFFSSLNDNELDGISSKVILREFHKNETILSEEDTNLYMYVIIFGQVKVVRSSHEGKDTILAIHRGGDYFGEMSLIDGKTAPATVVATEESLIGLISKKNFYSLLLGQDKILDAFLHSLCSRLRDSWKKIELLNFKYAAQRIKMLFHMLSEEHGEKTADGITLKINMTHQDIADMTGLTRETATRAIDSWQKEGDLKILQQTKYIFLSNNFLKKSE